MSVLHYQMKELNNITNKSYKSVEFFEKNMIDSVMEPKLKDCYSIYPFRDKKGYIVVSYYGELPFTLNLDKLKVRYEKTTIKDVEELRNGW